MKLLRAHPRLFSLVAAAGWARLRLLRAVLCAASAVAVAQQGTPVDTQNRELRHARLYGIATSKTFDNVNRTMLAPRSKFCSTSWATERVCPGLQG